MIENTTANITTESTMTGEKIAMGIHVEATGHVMSVLTNMYSDSETAVLREYSTNARDSHIEAGVTRPIRITTPTDLAPFLKIQDFGIGMSVEDIRTCYSQYGASTKRDSNEYNGMLGIGGKAALTYASQFTLVAVKDGFRSVVAISREEDGGGSMTVVEMVPTDEPNGVEIQVPAKRYNNFEDKANFLFSFWRKGTVLVNGLEPEPVNGVWIDEDMCVIDGDQDYLVMADVPYPVDFNVVHGSKSLVAYVPTGSVTIAPSREGLRDTALTKDTIATVKEFFNERAGEAAQREVAKAATPWEAIAKATVFRTALYKKAQPAAYTYNGKIVPELIRAPWHEIEVTDTLADGKTGKRMVKTQARFVTTPFNGHTLSGHNRTNEVQAYYAVNALTVVGYDAGNFTAAMKKRLIKYCEQQNIKTRDFILCSHPFAADWLNPERTVDWAEIKKVTLPHNGGRAAAKKIKGSYKVYIDGTFHNEFEAAKIDTNNPVYYVNTTTNTDDYYMRGIVNKYRPKHTIVLMPANRLGKFLRDFPKAKSLTSVVEEIYNRITGKLTEDEVIAYKLVNNTGYYTRKLIKGIDPNRVSDPVLRKMLTLAKRKTPIMDKIHEEFDTAVRHLVYSDKRLKVEVKDLMENYPLFDYDTFHKHPDHVYTYLNATYVFNNLNV